MTDCNPRPLFPQRAPGVDGTSVRSTPRVGMPLFDLPRQYGKYVVFFEYKPTRLQDIRKAFLVLVPGDGTKDGFTGTIHVAKVDGNETLFGKVVAGIRTSCIEGESGPEEGVGELLRPVMFPDEIFDCEVISVCRQGLGFVIDRIDPE